MTDSSGVGEGQLAPLAPEQERNDEKQPLYVEAECFGCGRTIIRYRWETTDRAWIHADSGKRACQPAFVARPVAGA